MKEFFKSVALYGAMFSLPTIIGLVWFYNIELDYRETETREGYKTKSLRFRTSGQGAMERERDEGKTVKLAMNKDPAKRI